MISHLDQRKMNRKSHFERNNMTGIGLVGEVIEKAIGLKVKGTFKVFVRVGSSREMRYFAAGNLKKRWWGSSVEEEQILLNAGWRAGRD